MHSKIFAGSSNPALAKAIASHLKIKLSSAVIRRFSDGEIFIEIKENVRGRRIYLIQSTSTPAHDHLMELLIFVDALKRASAESITAVIPYYGYARQDRKVVPRTPISAKLVADLLTAAGCSRVVSMDLHAGQIQGFFNVPSDNLFARPVLLEYLQSFLPRGKKIVIVSPDSGGVARARSLAERLGATVAIIDKRREGPNRARAMSLIGEVKGMVAVIVDDMIDTAGTLVEAAEVVKKGKPTRIFAAATHGILSGNAVEKINKSPIEKVIITDTILQPKVVRSNQRFEVLSVSHLLAEAIRRIDQAESVSLLFA